MNNDIGIEDGIITLIYMMLFVVGLVLATVIVSVYFSGQDINPCNEKHQACMKECYDGS